MKYVLVALVVIIAIGIWRNNRRKATTPPAAHKKNTRIPEDMVTCAHCGLHLPASDAITSPDRQQYCCTEHRHLGPS